MIKILEVHDFPIKGCLCYRLGFDNRNENQANFDLQICMDLNLRWNKYRINCMKLNGYYNQNHKSILYPKREDAENALDWVNSVLVIQKLGEK